MKRALLAEVGSGDELVHAITELRATGYRDLDAFAPHEVDGLDAALGLPRSRVARFALAGGLGGLVTAYLGQLWITVVAWPLDVGGRPLHSAPAFVPITFELTVLGAALATAAGLVVKGRLGHLWQAIDEIDELRSATLDGFWVAIDTDDPFFDGPSARAHLAALGVRRIVALGEEGLP